MTNERWAEIERAGTGRAKRGIPGWRNRSSRQRRLMAGLATAAMVVGGGGVAFAASSSGGFGQNQVGTADAQGGILLPSNQRITPLGSRYLVDNGRLLSSTISPSGKQVAALSWENFTGFLTILDATTGKVIQQVGTGATGDPTLGDGTVAADGPFYSPDGKSLWFPQTEDLLRFPVQANGTVGTPVSIPLVDSTVGPYLPSGMALSADGSTLYVALNGANTLGVIDTATNTLVRQIPVGNAPRQVVLSGGEAFVSNEGGRPARPGDFTNLSDNTPIVSDRSTGAAITGTVSVVDLASNAQTASIPTGLQPTALYLDGTTLFAANSNNDSVSVIDTVKRQVTQTINVNPLPGSTVGSEPNAITMTDPGHLLVSVGRDNAIVVFAYNGETSPAQLEGLIPTDWYPVNVQMDAKLGKLIVTNDKGIGARGGLSTITEGPNTNPATGHNTYDDTGSLTEFTPPTEADLSATTHQVFVDNDWEHLLAGTPTATAAQAATPVPVPTMPGQTSAIKHVFLIVKENRTYDQVMGDIPTGNGDPSLTQFGTSVTPNQHSLAKTYGLFDNFYDEGTLSADGHNWLVQADANDYIEKEFGAFYRSYPAQGGDALAYQRDGFIWNAAAKAGNTVADFGEYANFLNGPTGATFPSWSQWYQDSQILEGKAKGPLPVPLNEYKTVSDIPSLNAIIDKAYPKFDTGIPDQYRADIWERAFAKSEASGTVANLNLLWVPDDHTSGTSGTNPYPTAQVADNDLAVGRIVDTITHSKEWPSTAIYVVEDDPQAGADHVDGHRSTLEVISPYSNRNSVNSTYYSQINIVRTIEAQLGIAPMNQEDRAAEPMTNAFTSTPNLTPFSVLPNEIPLTYGLNPQAATAATAPSPSVPAAYRSIAAEWAAWSNKQHFSGLNATQDQSSPALLNRIDWYASTNWSKPYPGDSRIFAPSQVPGANIPADDLGDN